MAAGYGWLKTELMTDLTTTDKNNIKTEVNGIAVADLQAQIDTLKAEIDASASIAQQAADGYIKSLSIATEKTIYKYEILTARHTIESQTDDQLKAVRNTIKGRIGTSTEIEVDQYKLGLIEARLTNTPPAVSITAPAGGSTTTSGTSVSFTGTATDTQDGDLNASLRWTSSRDGALGTGSTLSTTSLTVGTHTITASASDSQGLVGSATVTVTVNAVATAPTVSITAPSDGGTATVGQTVTFTGTATAGGGGDLSSSIAWTSSRDGALGTGGSISKTLSAGTHTITATVTDSGGTSGSASITVVVRPANIAPTVTITAPAGGTTVTEDTSVTFRGTATDSEDGDLTSSLRWTSSRDGLLGTGGTISKTLSAGSHTITASVSDREGLAGSASITLTVNTVNAPTVRITAPADGSKVKASDVVTFTGTATDGAGGDLSASITWTSSRDGALGTGASVSKSLSAGTHTITASASDSQGRAGSTSITVTVEAVTTAPTVTITAPSGGTTVTAGTSVTFTGTAADSGGSDLTSSIAWTSSRDGSLGTGGSVSAATLTAGTHTITASVTDAQGMSGSASITLTVNASGAPTVSITAPSDGSSVDEGKSVTFTGTASSGGTDLSAEIKWSSSRDGALVTGASAAVPSLSAGTHTITASVTDAQGASGSASITVTVKAAAGAPTVTITAPSGGTTVTSGTSVTFTGTARDAGGGDLSAQLKWTSSRDGALGTGASVTAASLTDGSHTVTASVSDAQGVSGSASVTVTVNASGAPAVKITAPSDGTRVGTGVSVTFTGTAKDSAGGDLSAQLKWTSARDGALGTGGSLTAASLSEGSHTVTASATDSQGVSGSASVTVNVDSKAKTTKTTTTTEQKSKSAVMFSASVNVEHSRKFAFESSAASKVDAKMVSVPAPSAFLEAIKADALGRAKKTT